MRKYYIPTSSLNFNNILSSESISPKAFYSKRSFGYARWTSIPENPFESSVVLYDQLYAFNRPASDYEDHPMIVEITLDEEIESTLVPIGDHIFLSDHSIYIDPFSTYILFFSEKHRQIALSLSDSSVETKVVQLYRKKIQSINLPAKTFPFLDSSVETQPLNINEIEKDKKLNRMKGFLYGYYIGAILSTSKEIVVKLNSAREIRNILTAILSSFDHKATRLQSERLKTLYTSILPPARFLVKLSALVPEKALFNAIRALVIEEYGYIKGDLDIDTTISRLLSAQLSQKAKNPIMEEINDIISQTESAMSINAHLLSVQNSPVVVIDGSLEHINNIANLSNQDKNVVKAWVNEVLTKDDYNGKVSTFREALSDDVTRKAKEVFEAEWKGSYPEITLNSLRRHLRGSDFEHQWNNDIYSSISAVLVRGDDWQKLWEYMQSKEMTDYSWAFAFYGTLNGFANLSRDFTDVLFGRDRNYIAEVYKEFYGQLFKRNVVISANSQRLVASSIIPAMNNTVDGFPELMNNICKKCSRARNDEGRYRELYIQYGGINQAFVEAVSKDANLNQPKGVQKSVLGILDKLVSTQKKAGRQILSSETEMVSGNLFEHQFTSSGIFIKDYDFLTNNAEFVEMMSRINKNWRNDLKLFIDVHNPSHEDYEKYPYKYSSDNATAINHFMNLHQGRYRSVEPFLKQVYLTSKYKNCKQ